MGVAMGIAASVTVGVAVYSRCHSHVGRNQGIIIGLTASMHVISITVNIVAVALRFHPP